MSGAKRRRSRRAIRVAAPAGDRRRGIVMAVGLAGPCALGRSGIRLNKREGDGATPAGVYRLVAVLYRPDRVRRPRTALPVTLIHPDSGWCVVVIDHNLARPVRGAGSAVFLHLATPDFSPTAGCVAMTETAMRRLLARAGPRARVAIR